MHTYFDFLQKCISSQTEQELLPSADKITNYSSLPNNRVYTAIYFPKFSLVHALIRDVHDYLFSSFCCYFKR